MADPADVSRRERQILEVLFAKQSATAAEVHALLPEPPSLTAVRTLLRILEEKGHIKHRQSGPRYVYEPVLGRQKAGRSALQQVLSTFFDGSLESAVAAHLNDPSAQTSPAELARLLSVIKAARKRSEN